MAKKYNLKIPEKLVKIFEVYIQFEPLTRYNTVSKYLNKVIDEDADRILNFLKSKHNENEDLKKILKEEKYQFVKKALNFDID